MTTLTINDIKLDISFDEEIEGTYVVRVSATKLNNEETDVFLVNCQSGMTYDYKVSSELSASNDSGGDIYDSGLKQYLEDNGVEECGDSYTEVVEAIEAEAQKQVRILTVEDYLEDKFCKTFEYERSLAGACYAPDSSLYKYISEDGTIIVVAEDLSENVPEHIIQKYREFLDEKEYSDWFDIATENHEGHWEGDINLAYMLYKAL